MNKINPFSALYYMKENRGRTALCIFMMFLATLMFLAGNYIHSELYTFEKEFEYSDKLVLVNAQNTDEEFRDFLDFKEKVRADEKLQYVDTTAYGFSGMQHGTVLNLEMGGWHYTFNSVSDMEKVFAHLGIEGDFSACKHRSMIISRDFANNKGIKLGDVLDRGFDSSLDGAYTVDAIIDDGSYCTFYIYEDDANLWRFYIYSDTMEGTELYDYVKNLAGDRLVQISESDREEILPQFYVFYVLFYGIDFLIAVVLAVTINSVVTGQYIKRTYEFGVYRAIGRSKREVRRKVAAEVIAMNLIACVIGFISIFLYTYIVNELVYKKEGLHLLYASGIGVTGFIICDVLIVIPLILSKGVKMGRADVTEF
ncbi:MAG: ABC transporter permease [Lachnospiraceae bacterium]|nr:ABC transporter permease [Lachnospiraceae bacterium]